MRILIHSLLNNLMCKAQDSLIGIESFLGDLAFRLHLQEPSLVRCKDGDGTKELVELVLMLIKREDIGASNLN